MTDDRAERLRKRRKQSTEGVESERQPAPASNDGEATIERSDSSNGASESGASDSVSIKEEQIGTYMYLPEIQTKELRRLYNVLKAEYEFEYDEEFEKNRHFYPLVVQYGIEGLDGLDTSEIRSRLEQLYE
ncbi:hypothetical protein [Halapricum desulfuricans]|uniref:DUF8160 domain-containing protein n=1 Tax=Halapricum desulfuricans TaxID=2841257 RepID=A0A897MX65_9EURY|nr:hypothetical protein [Halapricum desulfuricans]QSG04871.1 Uncharacterized protein HSR121_0516 [Halapricum desulfuricans]